MDGCWAAGVECAGRVSRVRQVSLMRGRAGSVTTCEESKHFLSPGGEIEVCNTVEDPRVIV
jgi:hypothetical protein